MTWRLADSLPQAVLDRFAAMRCVDDPAVRRRAVHEVEGALDRGFGSCVLLQSLAARAVVDALFACRDGGYELVEFVVMPNHVHCLVQTHESSHLKDIVRHIKGASARRVNESLHRAGRLWQPDYFDRLIRSPSHFKKAVEYIHWNPVKAKLCVHPEHYSHSSANPVVRLRLESRTEVRDPNAG